jgi:capsular exopolysaccharide synthesis family protein
VRKATVPIDDRQVIAAHDGGSAVKQALRVWRRHVRLFLICFFAIFIPGVAVLETLKPSYTATAFVAISPQATDPLAPPGQPQAAIGVDDDLPSTDAAVMMSRDVAGAVLTQIPPLPTASGFSIHGFLCNLGPLFLCPAQVETDPLVKQQHEVDAFLKTLVVTPELHSSVIDVAVTAKTGARAALLANAVVTNYQRLDLAQQTAAANNVAAWLDMRTGQLRQRWLDAVNTANAFSVSHGLTNAGNETTQDPLVDRQVADMAANLGAAQARLAAAQAQADALHDAATHGDASALLALPEQPILVAAASSLIQLQSTRGQLAAEFGADYPKIKALDRQIAATQAILSRQTTAALGSIGASLVAAKAEVGQLNGTLNQLRAQAGGQSAAQAQFVSLNAEAASARTVYENFLEHSNNLVNRAALLVPPVVFVSHAWAPSEPTFPNKRKLGMAVLVLALVAGMAAVFTKDFFSEGFEEADDLRAYVKLPLLATIPIVEARNRSIARYILDSPFSRASDAVRGLAATLSLLAAGDGGARCVLVTSAGAHEGKSTLAVWLALTVRQGGKPVLVIDGDHRRGLLMQSPGTPSKRGLTDLLTGSAAPEEVIQTDTFTKLDFIAAGNAMSGPFGAEEIERLRGVVSALKRSYSLIVIDSPPLLAMIDGLVLSNVADQTVFVCRWQQTSRKAVTASLERLHAYGARISGIVVSMVDANSTLAFGYDYSRREIGLISRLYSSEGES